MMFARFDPERGALDVVNAGMPDPMIVRKSGAMELLAFEGDRLPLGARRASEYRATTTTIERGDKLVAVSDGLPEAMLNGAPIGYERTEELVKRMTSIDALFESVKPARIDDDLTVVVLERV